MRKIPLVIVLFVAALAWWLNDPLPQDFSEPWKLRAVHILYKFMFTSVGLLDKFGLLNEVHTMRRLLKFPAVDFPDGVKITDETFDDVPVRVYRHEGASKDQPGLIYYHGGGWVFGPENNDIFLTEIMSELQIVLVSVDYRLAPEHIFPAAFEDCLKVTKYFFRNVEKLGVDPRRVAISGDSAGGNLAAAVALKLRDEHFSPMPAQQILVYPVLQGVDLGLPSYIQNTNGPVLSRTMMAGFISKYAVGSNKYKDIIAQNRHVTTEERDRMQTKINYQELSQSDSLSSSYKRQDVTPGIPEVWEELQDVLLNPYFSPLLAENLTGLPEAYVFSGQYDVLRDEAVLYVKRLRNAGVPVTHIHGKNSFHGACVMKTLFVVEGQECLSNMFYFMKKL